MNANIHTFEGKYTRQGKEFVNPNTENTLIIAERKAIRPNKPHYFLLRKMPNNKRLYVSSLYPIQENQYRFDYRGKHFQIDLENDCFDISMVA